MRPLSFLTLALLIVSCKKNIHNQFDGSDPVQASTTAPSISAAVPITSWTSGLLPITSDVTQHILPNIALLPLNVVKSGPPVFKSNNPEIFRGNGWLMQNSRTDASRGGQTYPLTGTNTAYLFHINQSGASKYIHLLVTNPNSSAITVTSKGSYYTNAEKPLNGKATGQSYFVAKDWLNNTLRQPLTNATSINQGGAKEIFKLKMNNANMVDARFEITTSGNAYYYTVVTSNGNANNAINATQGSFAPGDYFTEMPNTYARDAGIYEFSKVSASNSVDIPDQPAHIGFALNTANKFFSVLENQTAPALMTMGGASSNTYGNYGHQFNVTLDFYVPGLITTNQQLIFESN